MRCEDYPCCGHEDEDGSFCPDEQGRFSCVRCGEVMPRGYTSVLCVACHKRSRRFDHDLTGQDQEAYNETT